MTMMDTKTAQPTIEATPVHRAEDLTAGTRQARIVLGEQVYKLHITRAGKLILTK